MDPPPGKLPDEPGLHGAKEQLSTLSLLPGSGDVIQDPFELGAGEVGIHHQAGLPANGFGVSGGLQLVAVGTGPAALPDDGVAHWFAGGLVPNNGGLTLVGDADSGDVGGGSSDLPHGLHGNPKLCGPDLVGVVLYPAGLGEDLGKFLLSGTAHMPLLIEENAAVAGGPGVKGQNVSGHSSIAPSQYVG